MIMQNSKLTRAIVVADDEKTPFEKIEGNADLIGFKYKVLRPDPVSNPQNFTSLVHSIKHDGRCALSEEEIKSFLAGRAEKINYIIIAQGQGTAIGFLRDNKVEEVMIPKHTGDDCLIEIDTGKSTLYVDCTHRKIFTPEELRWRQSQK